LVVEWASTARELVETSLKQLSIKKRVAGIVFNFVVQDRAQKYGGEYYYGKSYEKYYSQ
jgi:Mrp family chromosome partitioning ATPase